MSRSFVLATFFFAVSVARAQDPAAAPSQVQDPASTASPASAQDSTKPAPKKKKVWTNENLSDANGTISIVGDPQNANAPKAEAKRAPDKSVDPRLVANLRQRLLALQAQSDSVDKELADLKNFSKGDSKGSGGLKSQMNYSSESVDDQIRGLQKKKTQIEAAIDAVFDAARAKGIEPGQLR